MAMSEKTRPAAQVSGNAFSEMQAAWVSDAVSRLKRVTAAETDISRGIAQLVDASLGAAILSQKDFAQTTNDAIASNDSMALMMLPQKFLHAAIREGLENSVRNLQSAQTLLSQIYGMTPHTDEAASRNP